MQKIIEIEFSKLRFAYVAVKEFLELESSEKLLSNNDQIYGDLGLSGDDNVEVLEKFVKKFELDYSQFNYKEHFHSEGELYGSEAAFWNLLTLSIWLPLKTLKLIGFNNVKLPSFYKQSRIVKDLTFRDLINWYVENKFSPDSKIIYKIATNT